MGCDLPQVTYNKSMLYGDSNFWPRKQHFYLLRTYYVLSPMLGIWGLCADRPRSCRSGANTGEEMTANMYTDE